MGGLFSSRKTPTYDPTPAYTVSHSDWQDRQRTNNFVPHTYRVRAAERSSHTYRVSEDWERPVIRSTRVDPQIRRIPCVPANRLLRNIILKQEIASNWDTVLPNKQYNLTAMPENSDEYMLVQKMFKQKAPKYFKVTKIIRIQNPYLLGCYLLKKDEMRVLYGEVDEMLVFHGTKMCNVEKICTDNFNWRLHGGSVGNRFGKGVSFSPKSSYASNYGDKTEEKVMFVVRILYREAVQGSGSMELPPPFDFENKRYDTAIKENFDVVVKFCDNEFYPQYLIYYTGLHYKRNQNRRN